MNSPDPLVLEFPDEAATAAFSRALAPLLDAGDVLALSGPVGAGKSFFARHVIQSRLQEYGVEEEIPSPTFTLVQVYNAGPLEIWHCDLYRLADAGDAWELGLDEAFDSALCLVEWPDRLGAALPASALRLDFAHGDTDDARQLTILAATENWQDRVLRAAATLLGPRWIAHA